MSESVRSCRMGRRGPGEGPGNLRRAVPPAPCPQAPDPTMPHLEAIIRELAGPLRAEARTGYRDTTILKTSIGDYARVGGARPRGGPGREEPRAGACKPARSWPTTAGAAREARGQLAGQALGLLEKLGAAPAPAARQTKAAAPKTSEKPAKGASTPDLLDQPAVLSGRGGRCIWPSWESRLIGICCTTSHANTFP